MDGTRSALIIATDRYADPGLRRLRAPASDARALAAVLRDPGIGGFEVRTLLNEPAHVVNLAVEEFFADRRPGDLLLVHVSGHGVKDEDGELYFAASNTVLGRLGATAVAAEFVSRRMSRSRSRRVVLLLDCCYAGAFERGLVARAGTEMGIEQQFGGRGRAVITASSAMEYAFEAGELADAREVPPSVFTSALVQGLETGEADRDQDGLVGLDELYDYVYDQVRAATPNQTPGKWAFGVEGGLYIARRSRPVTTPAPLPPELRHAIDSPLAGVRAGAVQELARVLRGSHAGMALAARLALEQLTEDDSRAVAAAAAALGAPAPVPPRPARPELVLSDTALDLGRLPQHGRSPEHRIRISNAGGGDLNARAATPASWLRLRQAGDELVVAADTSTPGEHEGTITIDSGGGTATIRVHAQVDPAPPPAPGPAAPTPAEPAPGTPAAARPEPELPPGPEPVPDVAAAAAGPVPDAAGAAAAGVPEPEPAAEVAGAVAAPGDGGQRPAPPPRDDHPRVAPSGPGPGEKTSRAPGPRRALWRRPVIIATAIGIAVIVTGLILATTTISGTPSTSARWTYTTGGPVTSSPAVAGGTVYVGSDHHKVYALDTATGHPRWTYTTGDLAPSGLAVAGDTVYVGGYDRTVHALDTATGRVRWTYSGHISGSYSGFYPGLAVGGGTVVFVSAVHVGSGEIEGKDYKVYALDAATGHPRWTYATGAAASGPAVAGGTVYVGSGVGVGSGAGKVHALDAATGRVRWTYTTGGPVSDPAVAGGTVYVGSDDQKVYALDAATGHPRWTRFTGDPAPSSPAVAGGTVYFGSGARKVYALDAATGHPRWTYATGAGTSGPAVAGGTVYVGSGVGVGSGAGKVHALDAATGRVRWTYTTGGPVSDPAVAGGTVYVSQDRKVYALDAES